MSLTPGEFKMLHLFLRKAGCPLTQDEIRTTVFGYSHFITVRDIDKAIEQPAKQDRARSRASAIHPRDPEYRIQVPGPPATPQTDADRAHS